MLSAGLNVSWLKLLEAVETELMGSAAKGAQLVLRWLRTDWWDWEPEQPGHELQNRLAAVRRQATDLADALQPGSCLKAARDYATRREAQIQAIHEGIQRDRLKAGATSIEIMKELSERLHGKDVFRELAEYQRRSDRYWSEVLARGRRRR